MRKNIYQKPALLIVSLQQQNLLMTSPGVDADRKSYTTKDAQTWE